MRKFLFCLLLSLMTVTIPALGALANDADNVSDYTITGSPNQGTVTDMAPTTIHFTVDLGNPNNTGGEDPAANVKSQTYKVSMSNDGSFDQSSIVVPDGFTLSSFSPTSFTFTSNGGNATAKVSVFMDVTYNIPNLTASQQENVTMSGSATFTDGSTKQATPGTVILYVTPVYNYDYRDGSGKALADLFDPSQDCSPYIDMSNNNGIQYVGLGETIRLQFENLTDNDRKQIANGPWIVENSQSEGDASYEADYNASAGAGSFPGGNQSTTFDASPDTKTTTFTFSQNMPSSVTITGKLLDTTPPPASPSTGSERDPAVSVTWNFQAGTMPPTVAKEVSRTPASGSAPSITETYDVGLPYPPAPGSAAFSGWVIAENFSNYSGSGFTGADMDPNWLSQNGLTVSSSVGAIVQAIFTQNFHSGDSTLSTTGQFTDTNGNGSVPPCFAAGFLQKHTATISFTQTWSCGSNNLGSDQLTFTYAGNSSVVTKTVL